MVCVHEFRCVCMSFGVCVCLCAFLVGACMCVFERAHACIFVSVWVGCVSVSAQDLELGRLHYANAKKRMLRLFLSSLMAQRNQ